MKKFLSILLATMMVLAMVGTAFADEETATTYTLTINNTVAGHTYEAYQIFAGDLSNTGVLSNIVWGNGVTAAAATELGDAATQADDLSTTADAIVFANEVAPYLAEEATGSVTVAADAETVSYQINNLPAGYYLIKDKDDSLQGSEEAYTNYIVAVIKNTSVDPKDSVPELIKKVRDINDTDDADITDNDWMDSADHDIGDDVPFQLTGTLPTNFNDYSKYYYEFVDTMSTGLTYKQVDRVYVLNGDTATTVDADCYNANGAGQNLTVSFDDLKSLTSGGAKIDVNASSKIVVEFTATLNANADLGTPGNPNEAYLVFSNNPYSYGDGEDKETGKTPKDVAIVFTYRAEVNKVDGTGNPLTGAEFSLEKKLAGGTWVTLTLVKNTEGTVFTFDGLDDGFYRISETKTPEGFNSIEPVYFEVSGTHTEGDTPTLTGLTATEKTETNGDLPTGTTATVTFSYTLDEGEMSTTVENKSGATLPSTGGIGTTLFYLFGGIMAAGSALILIVRRRADAEEE